jgi:hypothetical protein
MRRISITLLLMVFVAVTSTSCENLGKAKEAFAAYKKEAIIETRAEYEIKRKALKFFVGPTAVPHIMKIEYSLESTEPAEEGQLKLVVLETVHLEHEDMEEGQLKLVVLETVHLEHEDMDGKMKRKNKHHVMMEENENGTWGSVDIEIEEVD